MNSYRYFYTVHSSGGKIPTYKDILAPTRKTTVILAAREHQLHLHTYRDVVKTAFTASVILVMKHGRTWYFHWLIQYESSIYYDEKHILSSKHEEFVRSNSFLPSINYRATTNKKLDFRERSDGKEPLFKFSLSCERVKQKYFLLNSAPISSLEHKYKSPESTLFKKLAFQLKIFFSK